MRLSPQDRPRIAVPVALTEHRRGWALHFDLVARAVWHRLPALLPVLLFVPIVLAPPLNQDVAGVLEFSQRWFAGEHLYFDLIDENPPLIFVLNLLPAAIAAWTPINAVNALRLCLLVYGGSCWWFAVRVRDRAAEGPMERAFLDVLPGLFVFCAGYDFGQREHIMAAGALPYMLAASRRAAGEVPRGRIAVGLLAGAVFALKPHFLGIPAAVELIVLLGRRPDGPVLPGLAVALRRWAHDPVPWVMVAVWGAYLASLPLLFPDYLAVVVPMVWGLYPKVEHSSVWQLLATPPMGKAMCLTAPLVALAFWRPPTVLRMPGGALTRLLALAALAAFVSALVQGKSWPYHMLPIELFACALGGVLAVRWLDQQRVGGGSSGPYGVAAAFGGLIALYFVSSGQAPWTEIHYPDDKVAGLTALLQREAAGERVLVLSTDLYPVYPALNYAGAQSTMRMMDLWMLQVAYRACLPNGQRYRDVWEMGRAEFFLYRTTAEDFARAPPAAVVVDNDPGISSCGGTFDFIAYFTRHPLFAEVWSRYQLAAEWGRYRLYTLKG